MHLLTCVQCGALFDAVRKDARYCSAACRQEAHRGAPPRQQPRPQPATPPPPQQQQQQQEEPPPQQEPPPLNPTRRAWLSIEGRRCWFRLNWDPEKELDLVTIMLVTGSAHQELGQWWIGNTRVAVDSLRRQLRHGCRAEVFDYGPGGPLPRLFLLELMSSQHPLEQAMYTLLTATPSERWRKMVRQLSAYAHPDGVTGHRPHAADHLLQVCYDLLNEPDLKVL